MDELEECCNKLFYKMDELWEHVKKNDSLEQFDIIEYIYECIKTMIEEAIQVAAMAKRYKDDVF